MDLPAWAPGNVLRPGRYRSILIGQGLLQLPPGADAELGEYLAQVPFDRVGTDEELKSLHDASHQSADLLQDLSYPVAMDVPKEPRWLDAEESQAWRTLASLTGQGRAKVTQAAPGHVQEVRRLVFDPLTKAQSRQLREIGRRITRAIDPDDQPVPAALPAQAPRVGDS